jgi:localization factor PodJL
MKSNAPWSVKGIERDARETAKEAARREGMTVGEWLSQVIQVAGDPAASNGEIVGIKTADIVTAIEILNRRTLAAEHRSAAALESLARGFAAIADRVQRVEKTGGGAASAQGEVPADFAQRLAALEGKVSDKSRFDTLKALEKAVSQIAVQFDAAQRAQTQRQAEADKKLDDTVRRLETSFSKDNAIAAVAGVRDAVDAMSSRLVRAEKIASEAARLNAEAVKAVDPAFVEQTGNRLRVLGDEIKRGGDQIRALEASIRRMTDQIDAAEKRSAVGVQKVADTISELRVQIEQNDQPASVTRADIDAAIATVAERTEDRMARLQRSFDDMIARLDQTERGARVEAERVFSERLAAAPTSVGVQSVVEDVAIEETESSLETDDDDDFRFDLDAPEEPDLSPAPQPSAADAKPEDFDDDVFGGGLEEAPRPFGRATRDQGDLDEVLRALDSFEEGPPPPIESARSEPASGPTDFLKKARLQAKETAEQLAREAEEREQGRKAMSPKQKAILAAKMRRKKLAEQGLAVEEARKEPASPQLAPVEPAKPSLIGKAGGVLQGLNKRRAKSRAEAVDDFTPASDLRSIVRSGRPKGVNALIEKAAQKPVHTAIGFSAVVVAAAAGVLAVASRDHGPKLKPQSPNENSAAPSEGTAVAAPEVPAPSIDPRTLYFNSVAKLKSATSPESKTAAIDELKQAAALGHAPAQLQLGELYKLGQDVPADLALARIWYGRAAAGGNVLAMHRVGVMAMRGQGGPVDAEGAISWFERAGNLGLMDSQYNLGAIFHPGGDRETAAYKDAAQAYYWYSLASRNGDSQAATLAATLGPSLSKDARTKADAAVSAWKAGVANPAANETAPAS